GVGLGSESVVGVAVAGATGALAAAAPGREALGVGPGVQDVRQRLRAAAVSDRADGAAAGVSLVGLEPPSADFLPPAGSVAVLRGGWLKSESGCSDPPRLPTQECRKERSTCREPHQGAESLRPERNGENPYPKPIGKGPRRPRNLACLRTKVGGGQPINPC